MIKVLLHRFKWILLLASALSTLSAFAGIAMLSMITDVIGAYENGDMSAAHPFIVFVLAVVVVMAAGVISQYILIRLSSVVVYDIKKTLLQRILATCYEKIEKMGGHRVMATMQRDVSMLAQGLMMLPNFIYSAVTVILCLVYMLYSSWQLFIFVTLVVSLIIVVAKTVIKYAMIHQTVLREYFDGFFSGLKALTNGGKELNLNSNRRRHFYESVMLPLFDNIRTRTVKSELLFVSVESFASTLVFFLIGSIVYGAFYFLPGTSTEVVVGFVLVILYMVEPLSNVVGSTEKVNEVRVSLNKIEKLELAEADEFSLSQVTNSEKNRSYDQITLKEVSYRYSSEESQDGYEFSLGPVSANLKAGQITFITGGNGSGKSTFAKLLIGLYNSGSGKMYLDDKLVGEDISWDDYKSQISVIFSDFYVFDELLDNKGNAAEDDQVMKHLVQLQLDKKVSSKDGVLTTQDLSQGQRKRLALLQSYLDDANICVYDEWAADQDPRFKKYFYNELLPELKKQGKIIVIISHDEHYFHLADQLLKFEEGKLVEAEL